MFRKIVSNLSFSPALITQVGFYAHRLRQEEVTRRMTVVFVALTMVVQSLAVFSPPDSANASSEQDLIRGGVQNLEDFLIRYDKNTDDIRDIYTTLGITRDEIVSAKAGSYNSKDDIYSISRYGQYSAEQGETSFSYKRSSGGDGVRFVSPLALSDTSDTKKRSGTTYDAWIGQSSKLGWFAVTKSNASIATKGYPSTVTPATTMATSSLLKTITARNLSQNASVDTSTAKAFDKVSYTISVKNTGTKVAQLPLTVNIADALEYASLVDDGGGEFSTTTKTVTWNTVAIPAGSSEERTFALQLFSSIPATPTGTSNANSYDCKMTTTFGTSTQANVECPPVKAVESIIGDFPTIGIIINIVFSSLLAVTVIYFYLRTRQMKKEIRLIRHNINTGTI
ncbi:hypothetical protein HY312_02085 [Candidatus Saccharibacteria bacterium]|nr:hypothetical protein [Candidatus Saccharibacteria bacterium]